MAPLSSRNKRIARRFERKAVQLYGALFEPISLTPLATLTTTELSLNGMAFVTQVTDIQIEQVLTVLFRLEDDRRTVMQEEIIVKTIQADGTIGATFADQYQYNFDLDFYLAPTSDNL